MLKINWHTKILVLNLDSIFKQINMIEQPHTYIAKTVFGLEEVLAAELTELGATDVLAITRAVSFKADKEVLYKANLWCRTAIRILKPLVTFKVNSSDDLYAGVYKMSWPDIFSIKQTFMVNAVVNHEEITHSHYASLRVKDAIVDRFRKEQEDRPSIDTEDPDFRIHVHIYKDECTVLLDSSGDALYKRGYRLSATEAPMNEVLAAGLIKLSGWDVHKPLHDPMCGSGTFLIEAGLMACNIAPSLHRQKFGFQMWAHYDEALFKQIKQEALDSRRSMSATITGADISPVAVSKARRNIDAAGLPDIIDLKVASFFDDEPAVEGGMLLMNPPYGEKIQSDDILGLYKEIGDTLKKKYAGFQAWVISSNMQALKNVGLRPSRNIKVFNGALECKFCKFDMYSGSKKAKFNQEQ